MTDIQTALATAQSRWPYYAAGLARLKLVPDASIPTMATSKEWVTHYNSATLASWTDEQGAAVLVHELEHLLRRHSERCGSRNHGRFNVAADAEINQRLTDLPDGCVTPESLSAPRGLTAEAYYDFTDGPDGDDQDGDGDSGSGDSGSAGGSGGSGSGDSKPGDGSGSGSGSGSGKPQGSQPGAGQGSCGSAAGGPLQPHERGDRNSQVPNAAAADDIRKQVARAMRGYGIGSTAGDEMRDWAESELGIDRAAWMQALAHAVGRTFASSGAPTRWQWPGRRDSRDMGGAVLPRWSGTRPSCAVVIDTSGSISDIDLDMARVAAQFVGRFADATYYGCDTAVVEYGRQLPDRIMGGGGTDLTVGIYRAIANGATAVVVITDGMTPWPSDGYRSDVPVIIGANPSWSVGYGMPSHYTVVKIVQDE